MKKYTSIAVATLVVAGIVLPLAFVHATTKVVKHPTAPHTIPTHKALVKSMTAALRATGTLTATSPNSVTLATVSSGHGNNATTTKTYTIDSSTKFSKGGSTILLSGLVSGDLIEIILRQASSSALVARSVTDTGLGFASSNAKMNAKTNAVRSMSLLKK